MNPVDKPMGQAWTSRRVFSSLGPLSLALKAFFRDRNRAPPQSSGCFVSQYRRSASMLAPQEAHRNADQACSQKASQIRYARSRAVPRTKASVRRRAGQRAERSRRPPRRVRGDGGRPRHGCDKEAIPAAHLRLGCAVSATTWRFRALSGASILEAVAQEADGSVDVEVGPVLHHAGDHDERPQPRSASMPRSWTD